MPAARSAFLATDRTEPDAVAPDAASPDDATPLAQEPERQPRPATAAPSQDGQTPDEAPSVAIAPEAGLSAVPKDGDSRAAAPAAGLEPRPAGPSLLAASGLDRPVPAAAASPATSPIPLAAVPVEIGLRSLGGSSRFEIRLSPDDLGRIDVRLDIDGEKTVRAHLAVERPETLAFLTRDRGQLERVFEQAGLKPAEGGVAFSLRDDTAGGRGGSGEPGREPARPPLPALSEEERPARLAGAVPMGAHAAGRRAGIDLRI